MRENDACVLIAINAATTAPGYTAINQELLSFARFVLPIINADRNAFNIGDPLSSRRVFIRCRRVRRVCTLVRGLRQARERERETRDEGETTTLCARGSARDTSTADISEGRKNSEGPSASQPPEAMFDQLVTTGRARERKGRPGILLPMAPVNILGLPPWWTAAVDSLRNTTAKFSRCRCENSATIAID